MAGKRSLGNSSVALRSHSERPMPIYFDELQDSEIGGGEFTSVGGNYVGVDGVRRGAGGPKGKSEPVSYFPNAKGLKITGGNFMSIGGDFYDGHSRSASIPTAPSRPGPVPLGPQYESYGGYTYPHPSTPQRPATYHPTAPPQHAPYSYYGGGYGNPNESQSTGYHYPDPNQPASPPPPSATNANAVRPPLLQSQSAPTPPTDAHVNAHLAASVEFTHTRTEPPPPSHTEHLIRPPSGLDVPNHRPINPNPPIDIWAQRPGGVEEDVISDPDSGDENNKKNKKGKFRRIKNALSKMTIHE